jgi:hypothetical protein
VKLSILTRVARLVAGLTAAFAFIALAGCGGSYGGGGTGMGGCGIYGPCPTTPPTTTDCSVAPAGPNVTIDLNVGLASCADTTYMAVLGFSTDNAHSQVIKIPINSNVTFMGSTGAPHTADLLGSSFPATDTNPATAAAAGADISSANFSTGPLNLGASSAVYKAGVAGVYFFGCHFHYASNGMRTVLIVQ